MIVGPTDAGAALFGAALKAWERSLGNEAAFKMAESALKKVTAAQDKPTEYN